MQTIELDYQNFLGKNAEEKAEGVYVSLLQLTSKLNKPTIRFGCANLYNIFLSKKMNEFDGKAHFDLLCDSTLKTGQIQIGAIALVELSNY